MAGYELARFVGEVDDHFWCRLCSKVVCSPQECLHCQHLLCDLCSKSTDLCPYCNSPLQTKPPALYARKVYSQLSLHCGHSGNGCDAIVPISTIQSHEAECLYVIVCCASPICQNTFMRKDKQVEAGVPLVCSVLCRTVMEFKEVMETKDQEDVLRQFHKFLNEAKALVESQVRADLEPMQREIDQKLVEVHEFNTKKEELVRELDERKWKYHPGKWNGSLSSWTCCNVTDKFALGCRKLA